MGQVLGQVLYVLFYLGPLMDLILLIGGCWVVAMILQLIRGRPLLPPYESDATRGWDMLEPLDFARDERKAHAAWEKAKKRLENAKGRGGPSQPKLM